MLFVTAKKFFDCIRIRVLVQLRNIISVLILDNITRSTILVKPAINRKLYALFIRSILSHTNK